MFCLTFSDYRRWCSPQLFQSELDRQLVQWWKKGETFSTLLPEFQSSTGELLLNELSNFMVWLTVPRSYFDQMYHRLRNGQVWEVSPRQFNCTHGEIKFHFSPRSAVLFYVFQLSICPVQGQPANFSQMQASVTLRFTIPTNFCESQGHVWNRWCFDYFVHLGSMPLHLESSTRLGRATLQELVLLDHARFDFWNVWNTFINSEIISTFTCWCICPVPERLWNWYSLHLQTFARQLRCFWRHQGRI